MGMSIPLVKNDKVRGGEIVSRILAGEGVDTVFGIIDGTYFGFYSTLKPNGIRLITPRHETSAAHMAGAYARVTGRLGVCMASNGPGVANILPGIAVENAEGNRVLVITSSRREGIIDPDRGGTYQYFPQTEVTRPMTKWSCAVPSADRVAEVLRRALRISWTGRPGVVHVDIPESIMNGQYEPDPAWFRPPDTYRPIEPLTPTPGQLERAVKLLRAARKPLVQAGSGVVHALAFEELAELARLLEAPVTTCWGGRAAIDERDGHALPMVFVPVVNQARSEADCILALGTRFGETDWWGKPPYWGKPGEQPTIQVDLDPDTLGNVRPAALAVQADVKTFLRLLIVALRANPASAETLAARRQWLAGLHGAKQTRRAQLDKHLGDRSVPMNPAHVAVECQKVLARRRGGGDRRRQHGHLGATSSTSCASRAPRSATPKMGMLGAGVAQALGAQVGLPRPQGVLPDR